MLKIMLSLIGSFLALFGFVYFFGNIDNRVLIPLIIVPLGLFYCTFRLLEHYFLVDRFPDIVMKAKVVSKNRGRRRAIKGFRVTFMVDSRRKQILYAPENLHNLLQKDDIVEFIAQGAELKEITSLKRFHWQDKAAQ